MKLNAQTSWTTNQIDEFSEQVKNNMINFNSATVTLDNCVQIYSFRVDSLTENAHKLYQVFNSSKQKKALKTEKKEKKIKDKSGETYLVEPKTVTMDTIEIKGAWMMPLMASNWSDVWKFNNFELQFNLQGPNNDDVVDPEWPDHPHLNDKFNELVHHDWPYLPSLKEFDLDSTVVPDNFEIVSEMGDIPYWHTPIDIEDIKSLAAHHQEEHRQLHMDLDVETPNDADVAMAETPLEALIEHAPHYDDIEPFVDFENEISQMVMNNEKSFNEGPSLILDASDGKAELLWQTNENWAGPLHYKVTKPKKETTDKPIQKKQPKVNFNFVEHFNATESKTGASLIKSAFVQLKSTPKSIVRLDKELLLLPEEDFHFGTLEQSKRDFRDMEPYERIQTSRLWMLPISIQNKSMRRKDSKLETDLLASADYNIDDNMNMDHMNDYDINEPYAEDFEDTAEAILSSQAPVITRIPVVTNVQQIKQNLVSNIMEHKEHENRIALTEIIDKGAVERGEVQLSTLFVCLLHLAVENEWDLSTDNQNEVYVLSK